MVHQDHVDLIKKGVPKSGGIWADFGSGEGAFTLALRDLLGSEVEIFSIDQDSLRLDLQKEYFRQLFSKSNIHFINDNFNKPLGLPLLDGIVMANALHFYKDKDQVLKVAHDSLKPYGRLIIVEYNVDRGNFWVPHPVSFNSFKKLAEENGFTTPDLLETIPSGFLEEIYSALAIKIEDE